MAHLFYAASLTPARQTSARQFLQGVHPILGQPPFQNTIQNFGLYVATPREKFFKITISGFQVENVQSLLDISFILHQLGKQSMSQDAKKFTAVFEEESKCDMAVAYFHGLEFHGVVLSALKAEIFADENNTDNDSDEEND